MKCIIKAMVFMAVFLSLCSRAVAYDFTLSGYTEVGERSTAEDYLEEDTDSDYTFRNYHLKFHQKVSPLLQYDVSTFIYDKDYKTGDNLDSLSRIFKTAWDYYLEKQPEGSLKLDLNLKYKEKRYDSNPRNEYDQVSFYPAMTLSRKDVYTIKVSAGAENFDYLVPEGKDQFNGFGEIEGKRYFLEKKLMFTSSYRVKTARQKEVSRERVKHNLRGGFDYVFDFPWLYKVMARAGWGHRDTKEEEERDEDYDYAFREWYVKTEHRITPKVTTQLKYQYFKKDYITADLDHRGICVWNGWDYEVFNDKIQRLWFDFDLQYKDVDYPLKVDNNYKKKTMGLGAQYSRKEDWKVAAGVQGNTYDYNEGDKDKKRYYFTLAGMKHFREGALRLSVEFKYRYTDYPEDNDDKKEAVRVEFRYRF